MGAHMVNAGGILARSVVLAWVLLPVDGSINGFWLI